MGKLKSVTSPAMQSLVIRHLCPLISTAQQSLLGKTKKKCELYDSYRKVNIIAPAAGIRNSFCQPGGSLMSKPSKKKKSSEKRSRNPTITHQDNRASGRLTGSEPLTLKKKQKQKSLCCSEKTVEIPPGHQDIRGHHGMTAPGHKFHRVCVARCPKQNMLQETSALESPQVKFRSACALI